MRPGWRFSCARRVDRDLSVAAEDRGVCAIALGLRMGFYLGKGRELTAGINSG